jgi:hypothetical protein
MNRTLKITIVAILLIVVIIVVVHPRVDLEPTVVRHLEASVLSLVAVVVLRTLAVYQLRSCCDSILTDDSPSFLMACPSRIDLTCTRLC